MNANISVVIPSYKSGQKILDVINAVPENVRSIYVIDDACPDQTGKMVFDAIKDQRVHVIYNEKNIGVGGATLVGFRKAFDNGSDIAVKIDSDGQISPSYVDKIVAPLIGGKFDYSKGTRFLKIRNLDRMPRHRIILNAILSFTTKFATGYYSITDPTNGLIAISSDTFYMLDSQRIAKRFFFESDMLFHLNLVRAKVCDVSMRAIYEDEESNLKFREEVISFAFGNIMNFFKRVFYRHFVMNFHLPAIYLLFGLPMVLYGTIVGGFKLASNIGSGEAASAGTVILPTFMLVVGINMITHFFLMDVADEPS